MHVKLLDTVDHDGKRYEAGTTLELADDQAEALIAVKAAELLPAKGKTKAEG